MNDKARNLEKYGMEELALGLRTFIQEFVLEPTVIYLSVKCSCVQAYVSFHVCMCVYVCMLRCYGRRVDMK